MATNTPRSQESTETVTGPHVGRDSDGEPDHRYWRCQRCGLETTDRRLREGCFRCGRRPTEDRDEETGGGDQRDADGAWEDG